MKKLNLSDNKIKQVPIELGKIQFQFVIFIKTRPGFWQQSTILKLALISFSLYWIIARVLTHILILKGGRAATFNNQT